MRIFSLSDRGCPRTVGGMVRNSSNSEVRLNVLCPRLLSSEVPLHTSTLSWSRNLLRMPAERLLRCTSFFEVADGMTVKDHNSDWWTG